MRLSPLILSIFLCTILNAQHWEITEMASMPERVSNNAVCEGFINGQPYVYSFAGIDSTKIWSGIHLKSYRYSVMGDQWEIIDPLPDNMGKIAASASRVGDIIYIIGGYHVFSNNNEISSEKVHRYDIINNTYLSDGTDIPTPIDDQTQVVWRDSLIYVITGWSNFGNVTDVQIYNPSTDSWMDGTATPNTHDYKSFGSSGTIIGDTIYYFGGAQSTGNFPIQNDLRIGIINPDDPSEIEWSVTQLDASVKAYRPAATRSKGKAFWVGGSNVTYNYNGIAYNGSGGVPPSNRSLYYIPESGDWEEDFSNNIPMDLRSLAEINDTVKYIVGGMLEDQWVSNKTWRLDSDVEVFMVATDELTTTNIQLTPNPASDVISIQADELQPFVLFDYKIVDSKGKSLKSGRASSNAAIDISDLPAGVYFVNVYNQNIAGYTKLMKQ